MANASLTAKTRAITDTFRAAAAHDGQRSERKWREWEDSPYLSVIRGQGQSGKAKG